MVSRPHCMIHNNLNSFELSRISYFSAEFLLFAFTPTFCLINFLTNFYNG